MEHTSQNSDKGRKGLEIAAVVFSLIALILSVQANAIAKKNSTPQILELESDRSSYNIAYDQGREGDYTLATCNIRLRMANVGGVDTEIKDIDVEVSRGQDKIYMPGLHDNNGGYDTIDTIELTTYISNHASQSMSVSAHSTAIIVVTVEVLAPSSDYNIPQDWSYLVSPDSIPSHLWAKLVINFIDAASLDSQPVFCTHLNPM